jgi:VIT1/CCC1 family predicted Fe2+/Mn2+ transporter
MEENKNSDDIEALRATHSIEAISKKLNQETQHSYIKDFIYGAIDGLVTTFAVVGGVAGAGLSSVVVIVLGVANIFADGFSMAVSNYLGTKAEEELREKARAMELDHIEKIPEGEKEEIRQIFAGKGFKGQDLENVVRTITADKDIWVDTMLQEELGLSKEAPNALKAASSTFLSFFIFGALPLIPYLILFVDKTQTWNPFPVSATLTASGFCIVGALKGRVVGKNRWASMFETLAVGGSAALLAYGVGMLFKDVIA